MRSDVKTRFRLFRRCNGVYGVAVDSANNVVITGSYSGSEDFGAGMLASYGGYDMFLARFSSTGSHLWSKVFGSANDDFGHGLALDSNGNILVTGSFVSSINFGAGAITGKGGYDVFVAKFTSAGANVWSKDFGNTNIDEGRSIAVDASGNAVVTGRFFISVDFGNGIPLSDGQCDMFLLKLAP